MAVIFMFALTQTAHAQIRKQNDSARGIIPADSLSLHANDSANADTSANAVLERTLGIRISKDALPSVVTAEARDSAVLDMHHNIFYLYGDTKINYEDMKLGAGKVTYDQQNSMIIAEPLPVTDSLEPADTTKPTFSQGSEAFTYDRMQYNFKSKRAIVHNAHSQYGEGFVYSQQVKRNPDQSIYGLHNVYTTCSLDTPHFGIWAKKIKVIPGRIIASGPANIVIENVPTPVFLPFGLFPISQTQRSGFRMPTYTLEEQRGLGLTNGGYYFYLNDYADLLLMANIYSKGSWSGSLYTTYANRYHYNGRLSLSYAYNKSGESYEPGSSITKDFMVNWQHQTDAKARPGVTFNASVTAGTSSFYSNNSYNVNQILNNQYQSNISYSKTWANKPFNLTVSARHNQNTQTHQVNVTLPELNFYMGQFNPFKGKNSVGNHWYDKITVGYTFNASNQTSFYDSTFSFNTLGLNDFHNGMHHTIPISASYNIFRFINMTVGATYNEYWLTERRYQFFDNSTWTLDTSKSRGFYTARDFDANMQLSTRIYGQKMFKHSQLMGIRHVLTPTVGFNYRPDYAQAPFNYYYQTYLSPNSNPVYLSPYDGSVVGTPGLGQYGTFSSAITYGLNNNLQIKLRNNGKKDSTSTTSGRNVTLIDALAFSGSYNIAADSFKWSPVGVSFRTNILNILSISSSASFDPYAFNYEAGRRSTRTMMDEGKGLVRFTNANIALSASFHSKQNKDRNSRQNEAANSDQYSRLMQNGGYNDYIDFNVPWNLNVAYALAVNKTYVAATKKDTLVVTQNALFSGDFNLTSRWKFTFSSGYDFTTKALTFTSFDIYRDLHCWEMRLGTIPFGPRKSYNFAINVKASILQDLRLLRRRDYRDAL